MLIDVFRKKKKKEKSLGTNKTRQAKFLGKYNRTSKYNFSSLSFFHKKKSGNWFGCPVCVFLLFFFRNYIIPSKMTFDVEETLKRISSKKGVKAVVIVNSEGAAIRSTLD
ncbi:unnamed protein product [Rhizopus stolonifer]